MCLVSENRLLSLAASLVAAFLVSGSVGAAPPTAPPRGGRAPQASEAEKKEPEKKEAGNEAEDKPDSPPEGRPSNNKWAVRTSAFGSGQLGDQQQFRWLATSMRDRQIPSSR